MREKPRVFTMDSYEQRLIVRTLADRRNEAIKKGEPTEDLNQVLLKLMHAPAKRRKGRGEYQER